MAQGAWDAVDAYYGGLLAPDDPVLAAVLAASDRAGLPAIQVSALQGRMLMILAQAMGARRILEIGTLGGYSTVWLARALPQDGRLVTLEAVAHHADTARANLAAAGFGAVCEVRLGPAKDSLAALAAAGVAPFDFIFIDADKTNYPSYLEGALALARPGSMIVADNVVREGRVTNARSSDANVQGVRLFAERVAQDARLTATVIQTVGEKGHDGFLLARVNA